jgi:hypothetical protein
MGRAREDQRNSSAKGGEGVKSPFFPLFPKGEKVEFISANSPEALLPLKREDRRDFLGRLFQDFKVLQEFKSEQTKKGHVRIVSAGDWDIHRSVHSPRR